MPAVGDRGRYSVAGRSGATVATTNHAIVTFWNPHATKDVNVVLISYWRQVQSAASHLGIQRTTTRGTPGTTTTPDIDNDSQLLLAPISGVVCDQAPFSVQPTISAIPSWKFASGNTAGSGAELFYGGIRVPAGEGLVILQLTAAINSGDYQFCWDE